MNGNRAIVMGYCNLDIWIALYEHSLADMECELEGKKEIKEFARSPITFVVVNVLSFVLISLNYGLTC